MNKTQVKIKKKIEGVIYRFFPQFYKKHKNKKNQKTIKPIVLKPQIRLIDINQLALFGIQGKEYDEIIRHYVNHEFDLLGSGWLSYNVNQNSQNYSKIAWNRDIQSGYVWENANTDCFNYMSYPEGTDVKRVWELARLQHLLRMALYAVYHVEVAEKILEEYKNQVCDFMTSNPIGVGIHWTCSMEVGIRAINLILSYDVLRQVDEKNILDLSFCQNLDSYILNHGTYICENLELVRRSPVGHNHYYANLLGLLYISAYYDKKSWWNYAKEEFLKETAGQFSEDGSDFEGSTAYHALCTEMLILGTAILGRVEGNISEEHKKIVEKSVRYLYDLSGKSGRIPQIGDNDSGQVIKITPVINYTVCSEKLEKELKDFEQADMSLREDLLNVNPILAKGASFFSGDTSYPKIDGFEAEISLIKEISDNVSFGMCLAESTFVDVENYVPNEKYYKKTVFQGEELSLNGKGWIYYKDAGMLIYKSENAELFFNMGKKDNSRFTGHLHDDVLHCNITLNGKRLIEDPGTVTYTANKEVRDLFRSYKVHFVPVHDERADKYDVDVFSYERNSCCEIVGSTLTSVIVKYTFKDIIHYRKITVNTNTVEVEDFSNVVFEFEKRAEDLYSDNYGSICVKL